MSQPLTGVAALIKRRLDLLVQQGESLRSLDAPEFNATHEHETEIEALRNELQAELQLRRVVLLGVAHGLQEVGHRQNEEFRERLSFLAVVYNATILVEEWAHDRPASCASRFAEGRMEYCDVGTSGRPEFKTFTNAPITFPGHNGTLGPCPDAPPLMEYGPLGVQENREQEMLRNIDERMRPHRVGVFVVGLAHLHSMALKLRARQYRVAAYTWLG